jgi:hypothetical protein
MNKIKKKFNQKSKKRKIKYVTTNIKNKNAQRTKKAFEDPECTKPLDVA